MKKADKIIGNPMRDEMKNIRSKLDLPKRYPTLFEQPLAGKWYYEYRNDKGGYVGLAKLQDNGMMRGNFTHPRKWMWETCTTNKGLELRRFSTQKKAEKAIYKFLK